MKFIESRMRKHVMKLMLDIDVALRYDLYYLK